MTSMVAFKMNIGFDYQAPKPEYTSWEWFQFFIVRIAFPPLILWDLLTFAINKLVGGTVGERVLMQQFSVKT